MKVMVIAGAAYADPSTRRMFDHIAARGIEVTLVMPRRILHPFGPAVVPVTPWLTPGVVLERLDTWYSHSNGTHIAMKGLPALIRRYHPDIVHCVMEPWSITCLVVSATLAAMPRSRRPKLGVHPGESKPGQGGWPASRVRKLLYRAVLRRCDYFVGWSRPVLRAAQDLGAAHMPTAVAPAVGIDTDLFRPIDASARARQRDGLGYRDGDFVVGYAGRFTEEKGVTDLLAAMDLAVPLAPRLQLALLGTGPLESNLLAAAETRSWLTLLPKRDLSGVARFMQMLDLLVLPTRTTPRGEEQFGLVAAEAMACGVPVVGSTSGAIPEVLEPVGRIFPESNVPALADLLTSAALERPESHTLHLDRRRAVEERFGAAAIAELLQQTWTQVC